MMSTNVEHSIVARPTPGRSDRRWTGGVVVAALVSLMVVSTGQPNDANDRPSPTTNDAALLITDTSAGASCDEDLNGDGTVGVVDLLMVLDSWGDCPTTDGACCYLDNDGFQACQIVDEEADCLALPGGVFRGVGTECVGQICQGACCIDFPPACFVTFFDDCEFQGGTFEGIGVPCDFDSCPIAFVGACCAPEPDCCLEFITNEACDALGGTWLGTDTACSDCFPYFGACCLTDGTCIQTDVLNCEINMGGIFQGCLSDCDDVQCDP